MKLLASDGAIRGCKSYLRNDSVTARFLSLSQFLHNAFKINKFSMKKKSKERERERSCIPGSYLKCQNSQTGPD